MERIGSGSVADRRRTSYSRIFADSDESDHESIYESNLVVGFGGFRTRVPISDFKKYVCFSLRFPLFLGPPGNSEEFSRGPFWKVSWTL